MIPAIESQFDWIGLDIKQTMNNRNWNSFNSDCSFVLLV